MKTLNSEFSMFSMGYATRKGYSSKNPIASQHPAIFQEALVYDHLRTWTEEGDLVLNPFCGSGTTTAVAKYMNRQYTGIDISKEYCELARKRLLFPIDISFLEEQSKKFQNQRYSGETKSPRSETPDLTTRKTCDTLPSPVRTIKSEIGRKMKMKVKG